MSDWWCADFETTSLQNLNLDGCVRVWLWSLIGVEDGEKYYGTDIQSFLKTVKKLHCRRVFFHNLKFDGKFIVDYFMRNDFVYGDQYEVIIDGLGSWYEIKWHNDKKHTTKFWDSLKKFPGTTVKDLGKFVGLPKLDAPFFDRYYPIDYTPTQQEIDYCVRDSEVVAKAIKYELDQGYKSMTLATDCFKWAKEKCLNGRFYRDIFPVLDDYANDFCKRAYKGGISYLKPEYEDKEIHNIKVYDVNSLYPWVMHDCPLPYGYARYTTDKPKDDELYFIHFKAEFYVKRNKFPFLQIKNTPRYVNNQFILYSNGYEDLYMTSVDYKNFKNNYKVLDETEPEYLVFNSQVGLLAPHVDYWMEKKKYYQEQGMPFMRYIAKTFMNGFYGKTAMRTSRENVVPLFDTEEDQVSYSKKVTSEIEPVYVPYGAFVTSWARDKLINAALTMWDDFIYCDTDSIHCFDNGNVNIEVHPTDLGKWKDETEKGAYEYARYIKQKTYCHARPGKDQYGNDIKEVVEIRAAGLSTNSRTGIPFEDFKYGLQIHNANLKMETVPGGAILMPTDWMLEKDNASIVEEYFKMEEENARAKRRNSKRVL